MLCFQNKGSYEFIPGFTSLPALIGLAVIILIFRKRRS
ncbi:MAG: Heimdall-CTERM domain-containing surface protein [Candidatus Hodarchaeota archaeon]